MDWLPGQLNSIKNKRVTRYTLLSGEGPFASSYKKTISSGDFGKVKYFSPHAFAPFSKTTMTRSWSNTILGHIQGNFPNQLSPWLYLNLETDIISGKSIIRDTTDAQIVLVKKGLDVKRTHSRVLRYKLDDAKRRYSTKPTTWDKSREISISKKIKVPQYIRQPMTNFEGALPELTTIEKLERTKIVSTIKTMGMGLAKAAKAIKHSSFLKQWLGKI